MIKKIVLIACIVTVPTLTVAFAPNKGTKKKSYRDLVEVVIHKKAQQWKKDIISFFAEKIIRYNQVKK